MVKITHLESIGDQIFIHYDNGDIVQSYPTSVGHWIVADSNGSGPIPDYLTISDCENNSITLERFQLEYAVRIKAVADTMPELGRKGTVIAFMTVLVESKFLNYSNLGTYPETATCPDHADADGSDNDSVGLFQQRPVSGWGTPCQCMNPEYAAAAFFGGSTGPNGGSPAGVLDIPGWETMGYGEVCQAVQVSAFPDRYDCWRAGAEALYDAISSGVPGDTEFAWPFPQDQITSGFRPPNRPTHTGVDFGRGSSNVEGTPIPATKAGTVITAGPYFGWGQTVILDHGSLTHGSRNGQTIKSLYGHMVEPGPVVNVGDTVTQNQTLGGIGQTGESRGLHLHWEIWANDVKIDPEIFMREYGV